MKKNIIKIIFFSLALVALGIIVWVFKNLIIDIIHYAKINDRESIKQLIAEQGAFSYLSIVLVEAIQMIVVVIPAEFIQLAAGISFSPLIATGLCLSGVFIGATTIYFLVNVLKIDRSTLSNKSKRIDELALKKSNLSVQALMYLLFVMPIIPFGAICYFGSSKKIGYRRYIFTCCTGVLPAIITSIFLGNGMVILTALGIPLYAIILIIVAVMIILFASLMLFIKHKYFDGSIGSPNSNLYPVLLRIFRFIVRTKANPKFEKDALDSLDGPVVYISNHASFFDMYYACNFIYPKRGAIVGNRYYLRGKLARKITKSIGIIPKKLFTADLETIKLTIKSVKEGHSIVLFPEGRLSIDGSTYNIVSGTGALLKKLNVPVVIANINGAYLTNPKWRKKRMRGNVLVEAKAILMPEQLKEMTAKEVDSFINENIKINDFEFARVNNYKYKGKNKAKGLENVLFVCPHCKHEYTLETNNNIIRCTNCNYQFTINDSYSFDDNELGIKDINHFYNLNKEYQKELLNDEYHNDGYHNDEYRLETKVKVKKIDFNHRNKDKLGFGTCYLTKEKIGFVGFVDEKEVEFEVPMKVLKALAFSCGEEFEFYYNDELYYFYPEDGRVCSQYAMIVDILNEEEE